MTYINSLENIVGRGENAGYQYFLIFLFKCGPSDHGMKILQKY